MVYCFSFLLLVFDYYLYTSCVLCVPFPSVFNIFAMFTYQKKKCVSRTKSKLGVKIVNLFVQGWKKT